MFDLVTETLATFEIYDHGMFLAHVHDCICLESEPAAFPFSRLPVMVECPFTFQTNYAFSKMIPQ